MLSGESSCSALVQGSNVEQSYRGAALGAPVASLKLASPILFILSDPWEWLPSLEDGPNCSQLPILLRGGVRVDPPCLSGCTNLPSSGRGRGGGCSGPLGSIALRFGVSLLSRSLGLNLGNSIL